MIKIPVFILSDFGYEDTYTAQMKAAIMSFAGYDTPVIDLTQNVLPGNILQGAFHLRAALPNLPEGSVTLAVVDPGVGGSRLGLAALWRERFIVAPDNGLISLLDSPAKVWKLPPPDNYASSTFHGRDYFAPCAARIAVDPGWPLFLEPLEKPVLILPEAPRARGCSIWVTVLHTDHFGNCVLALDPFRVSGKLIKGLMTASGEVPVKRVDRYEEGEVGDELLLLHGSQGFLEIALRNGSAALMLGLQAGVEIQLIAEKDITL
jgi:S-adenosylmethionine hydrolase